MGIVAKFPMKLKRAINLLHIKVLESVVDEMAILHK
jgi:hypothetical protein